MLIYKIIKKKKERINEFFLPPAGLPDVFNQINAGVMHTNKQFNH